MLRNLVSSLFLLEPKEGTPRRVTTTVPKAKEARRLAEHAITLGKRGTLHARRQALALIPRKEVVKTLFGDIAPQYSDRNGGYTRIVRLAKARIGDASELCYLELVSGPAGAKPGEPVAPKVTAESEPKAAPAEPEKPAEEGGAKS